MKVIGHRGAAGLALENTLAGFELARLLGVDAIELDIHITKDNQIVAVHDTDLKRVSKHGVSKRIKDHTLAQIQKIVLNDGESVVPTLESVFETTTKVPLYIEIKAEGCVEQLLHILDKYPERSVTVVSFKLNELALLRQLRPKLKLVGLERTKSIEIIQLARMLKLDGIGLNFWVLNPLAYWLAKRANLTIYVYTVNSRFLGKFLGLVYPRVAICSDHPEWFVRHPYPIVRSIEKAKRS